MKDCIIDPDTWKKTTSNRPAWIHQVRKHVSYYEQGRIVKKKELRRRRKEKEANRSGGSYNLPDFDSSFSVSSLLQSFSNNII